MTRRRGRKRQILARCEICGAEVPEEELIRCMQCGKAYCRRCAEKDQAILETGLCAECGGEAESYSFLASGQVNSTGTGNFFQVG